MSLKRSPGRPKGSGKTIKTLESLKVGDSILLPMVPTPAAVLQTARNRFYNPAKRLGMKLSFTVEDNNVRVKRVE